MASILVVDDDVLAGRLDRVVLGKRVRRVGAERGLLVRRADVRGHPHAALVVHHRVVRIRRVLVGAGRGGLAAGPGIAQRTEAEGPRPQLLGRQTLGVLGDVFSGLLKGK